MATANAPPTRLEASRAPGEALDEWRRRVRARQDGGRGHRAARRRAVRRRAERGRGRGGRRAATTTAICSICFDPIEDGPVADPERRTRSSGHMFHAPAARAPRSATRRAARTAATSAASASRRAPRATGGPAGETPDWSNPDAREIRGVCARCGGPSSAGRTAARVAPLRPLGPPRAETLAGRRARPRSPFAVGARAARAPRSARARRRRRRRAGARRAAARERAAARRRCPWPALPRAASRL